MTVQEKKKKTTRKSIVKYFDGDFYTKYLAKGYDKGIKLTGWREKVGEHALDGIQPGKMLDVGCGTGFVLNLARKKGFDIHGVDPSEGMIKQAKIKYDFADEQIGQTTSTSLPFPDNTFDFVFASGSLVYEPNIEAAAKEMSRVLKKGGILRVIDHAPPKQKDLSTALVYIFTQASGYLIHDYAHYFSKFLKLVEHKTLGRGGYLQQFDFKK